MKTIDDINLNTWFVERELITVPSHFIKVNTLIDSISRMYILEKFQGRFAIDVSYGVIYFEDPAEATLYQLMFG